MPTPRPSWMEDARCSTNPALADMWFSTVPEDMAMAKRVCLGCPVRRACLDEALKFAEPYGIWGGLTARTRKPLRRALGAHSQPRPTGSLAEYYGR